ncbi:MAG: histidinol-phosphate transaminase [Melioribacter sp.]|nr:histidinol-phosphate transaminase [Melioribacter sp.]
MNIKDLVRKNILDLKPYTSARQSHNEGILLDANENCFGTVLNEDYFGVNRYPDPYQKAMREGVAKLHNIPVENLFFGVGSDEIIDLTIRIFCRPSLDKVIVCEPTYGMYKVACDINDVEVVNVPLTNNFNIDIDAVKKKVDDKTKLIFLCSPNNPTSNLLDKNKILDLTKSLNLIVVVDEAYIDFAKDEGLIRYVLEYPNLIIMRTFSKAWGMAGVRCGFCVASKEIIDIFFKIKLPYNISKLTSEAVLKAIQNVKKRDEYVNMIIKERERVSLALKANKKILNVLPSDANFISFKVENPKEVYNYLENHKIIIRDRSNQYNFSGYLRVTVGTPEENNLFLQKLNEIL